MGIGRKGGGREEGGKKGVGEKEGVSESVHLTGVLAPRRKRIPRLCNCARLG